LDVARKKSVDNCLRRGEPIPVLASNTLILRVARNTARPVVAGTIFGQPARRQASGDRALDILPISDSFPISDL
jgi:hypothetical protein